MKSNLLNTLILASKFAFRMFLLQLVGIQLLVANPLKSQELRDVEISINVQNVSIDQVFAVIESKSNFVFSFTDDVRDSSNPISMSFASTSIYNVLYEIAKQEGLRFKRINNNIMVVKSKKKFVKKDWIQELDRTIQGKVTDSESGNPLVGASVSVTGTSIGVITDVEGKFSLAVPDNAEKLSISYIGFIAIEIPIGSKKTFDISLEPDVAALNEVVVIGYGVQDKRDITTSIASVSAKDLRDQPVIGFDQAIVGKIAGVQVSEPSGEPGSGMRIRVRGTSSITSGNDPLYVIDGVPLNTDFQRAGGSIRRPNGAAAYQAESVNVLSSISTNDIESIEILKDASAAAIYGSRGSNGVVLITTKKGSPGKPKISYNAFVGFSETTKKVDVLDAYEYAELLRESHNNTYLDEVPTGSINDDNETRIANGSSASGLLPAFIEPYLAGTPGLTDTDWQDEVFRQGFVQGHNISISGGGEKSKYFGSINYQEQEGIVINSDHRLLSLRLNLETEPIDGIKFGFNFNPSQQRYNRINKGPHWSEGIVALALAHVPIWPVYNDDGSYSFLTNSNLNSDVGNLRQVNTVALAREIKNETNHSRFLGNIYGQVEVIENLNYRISFGFDINNFTRDYYRPSFIEDRNRPGVPSVPDAYQRDDQFRNWILEQTLTYDLESDGHNLGVLAGFSAQKEEQRMLELYATNFPNDLITTVNGGQIADSDGSLEEWSLLSYLSRVQYSYKGRYLLSAAIRADGSSRFGENNRWGYFPSFSAGWRVSNEPFFNSELLSDLKVRGSFGVTGNFQIPNYGSTSLVSESNYLDDSGNISSGLSLSTSANPDLKWERTSTIDVGLDIGLFDDRLYFEFDYYQSDTEDLLLNVPVPATSGFVTQLTNIGEVRNTGFEAAISSNFQLGQFTINAALNFATNKNEVLKLGPDDNDILTTIAGGAGYTFITRIGEEIGSYYALDAIGVLREQDIADGVPVFSGSKAGDIKNRDVNGDGVITDDGDRVILGSQFPDYIAGLNASIQYRNIDFGFNIQSVQGFEVNALINRYNYNVEGGFNNHVDVLNRYRSESNPGDGIVPRANRSATGSLGRPSSWHVEDGSFVRVRNLTLGYTLPGIILGNVFEYVRIYSSVQNPFTFTDYRYYNPEVSSTPDNALTGGQDYGNYPLARTYSLGLNITFK